MIKSGKKVIETVITPFQRFFRIEASGGILLMFFTVIALFWANSQWRDSYFHLWENHVSFKIGSFELSKTILHWINDGLMAIFFFVVGLEIKRELVVGELSSAKQAILPIAAAIGGMVLPATIYVLVNTNALTEGGWGIPMATDIAFSLGVLSLLGKRVPLSLKVFLVAFAIVDDLGAVLVIALFYSSDIHWNYLLVGLGLFLVLVIFNRIHIRSFHLYMVIGWVIWFMFLKSGIHPTIAGVLIAFTIPIRRNLEISKFRDRMNRNLEPFTDKEAKDDKTLSHSQLDAIFNMETEMEKVQSPVQSLEHRLHGFVTFIVMPLFALTNAGVVFSAGKFSSMFTALSGTIEVSLIAGKVLGKFIFTWISVKLGLATMPKNVRWVHILGLGFLGGMGFTMSLFISNLAFDRAVFLNPAKTGILIGSLLAGIIGYLVLRASLKNNNKNT